MSDWALHQPDSAVNELRLALAIEPYYTHAEELLGTIWLKQKRYDQARAQFSHLLTLNPDNYAAHYNLGALATLEGQWEDGERHLRAALKSDPLSAEAHNTLGSLYLRRQDLLRARRPASLHTCVLLAKPTLPPSIKVDFVGFEAPAAFVVGYGLDAAQLYRNLPYIGVIEPSQA